MNRTLIVCAFFVASAAQIHAGAGRQQRDEDVSFQSGANTLAGTVSLPSGAGPFSAVVLRQPAEYPTLPKVFVPLLLADVAGWIVRQVLSL